MLAVVADVVAEERQHGHRVAADGADRALGGGGLLAAQRGTDEDSVLPVAGLGHQGHRGLASAAEQDRRDRHATGVVPLRRQRGALRHRGAVPRIGMRRSGSGLRCPVAAFPIHEVLRVALQALPPHAAVIGQRDVGEDGVAAGDGLHRVRVGTPVGSGCHPEEAELRVDRIQPAVLAESHPGDVIAKGFGTPTGDGRLDHREIGLAAGRRERRNDVVGLVFRRDELEDQHVLGEPALVVGHGRRYPQRVALLAQQRVAAVAGPVAPDLPGLREVRDVLGLAARPRHVGLAGLQWRADRVQRLDEESVVAEFGQRGLTHPGHGAHGHHDVLRIGDLHSEFGVLCTEWAHAERHDVHGAAAHTTPVQLGHGGAHLGGSHPVIGRAGVDLALGTDERTRFNPGDIRRS